MRQEEITAGVTRNESVTPSEQGRVPLSASFLDVFRFWLKLGFLSFGGPAGQIAMMHRELVDKRIVWSAAVGLVYTLLV